ncbi:hypothetical protein [Pseudomonas sp. TUM22785]|uniref:hypothetical protein n=1 Tax=Pseudomonas sp. TUM22785 TaxID=3019098 RepID=UPI001607341E|nr:hypothetical protein [Pseudomonas sp. TUM22785]MBB4822153.1 CHASE2 domain-containing sensor protein [Pseudomonas alcaligenes]WCD80268.1 hypothetical protein PI990_30560 [Pseudomonas sp. TUM22785]
MTTVQPSPLLRRVLQLDALVSGAAGLLMTLGAGPLSSLLALPAALLTGAGLSMLPWCAVLLWLARRETLDRRAVWAVIAVNAVWVVDSLLLLVSGWVQPTLLGQAFVIAQALAVVLFAELQFFGLKRSAEAVCG